MWKFFHNGTAWWLRITEHAQLIEFVTEDKTILNAFNDYFNRSYQGKDGSRSHFTNGLSAVLASYAEIKGIGMIGAAQDLVKKKAQTYFELFEQAGFININSQGGCNAIDWPWEQVCEKEQLIWPCFKMSDLRIKTWKPEYGADGDNYKYHYYCYLGNIQLTDGDKVKWDTRQEAVDFAKKYIEDNGEKFNEEGIF